MNRNRIIKVILGVLTVLLVVWFCVLFYQDGYARDYGIYRSRTLLLMAVVLLLCCVVLFFYGSFFCKKGIGKVQICNFVFLIPAVASLGLWGNSAATKDEECRSEGGSGRVYQRGNGRQGAISESDGSAAVILSESFCGCALL